MAVCTSGSCTFLYSSTATPEVTNVTPDAISETTKTTLTLMGSNLKSLVEGAAVMVGDQECSVQSQSVDTIKCTITNLPRGLNDVSVDVAGFGSVLSSFTVTSLAVISSMTPVLRSAYGGTTISFMENRFTSDATFSIFSVACEVKSASLSEMKWGSGGRQLPSCTSWISHLPTNITPKFVNIKSEPLGFNFILFIGRVQFEYACFRAAYFIFMAPIMCYTRYICLKF